MNQPDQIKTPVPEQCPQCGVYQLPNSDNPHNPSCPHYDFKKGFAQYYTAWRTALERVDFMSKRLCKEIANWQGRHAMLRHENNKLRKQIRKYEADLKVNIMDWSENAKDQIIAALSKRINDAKGDELAYHLGEMEKINQDFGELKAERDTWKARHESASRERNTIRELQAKQEEVIKSLTDKLSQVEAERDHLRDTSQRQCVQLRSHKDTIDRLISEKDKLSADRDRRNQAIVQLNALRENARAELAELTLKLTASNTQLIDANQRNLELANKAAESVLSQKRVTELSAALHEARTMLLSTEQELQTARGLAENAKSNEIALHTALQGWRDYFQSTDTDPESQGEDFTNRWHAMENALAGHTGTTVTALLDQLRDVRSRETALVQAETDRTQSLMKVTAQKDRIYDALRRLCHDIRNTTKRELQIQCVGRAEEALKLK